MEWEKGGMGGRGRYRGEEKVQGRSEGEEMGEGEGGSEGGGWRSGPRGDRRSWLQKCFRVLVLREMNDARCIMAVLWKIKKKEN